MPVDADLLPEYVPGFKTPFRQCPPGVRPTLADDELTYLRKLARPLPTHFALGEYAFLFPDALAVNYAVSNVNFYLHLKENFNLIHIVLCLSSYRAYCFMLIILLLFTIIN